MMAASCTEDLHLSYSESHGQFVREDFFKEHAKAPMPQTKLNSHNAIMLNVRDQKKFQEVYEQTIKKHFTRQAERAAVPVQP